MPLDFPSGPTIGQTYTYGGRTWSWDGASWNAYAGAGLSTSFTVASTASTSFSLATTDAGTYIRTTANTAVSITVPPQSSVTWLDNTEIIFEQAGTGQITIVAGSGVTIRTSETLLSQRQYSIMSLKRVASDTWTLSGERQLL